MSQTTHDPFKEYMAIIRDLTAVAGNITRVEETKTAAASEKRHELLDSCIQEEQAYLLRLRGLEQHRTDLQKTLGWDSYTLRQILAAAPPEQKEPLIPLFENLERQLNHLQQARESAEQIIKVRLHELEIFTRQGASYDNSRNVSPAGAGHARIRNKYV